MTISKHVRETCRASWACSILQSWMVDSTSVSVFRCRLHLRLHEFTVLIRLPARGGACLPPRSSARRLSSACLFPRIDATGELQWSTPKYWQNRYRVSQSCGLRSCHARGTPSGMSGVCLLPQAAAALAHVARMHDTSGSPRTAFRRRKEN